MTLYNYAVSLGSKKVLFKMLGERYAVSACLEFYVDGFGKQLLKLWEVIMQYSFCLLRLGILPLWNATVRYRGFVLVGSSYLQGGDSMTFWY